jgi:hypothetical protein
VHPSLSGLSVLASASVIQQPQPLLEHPPREEGIADEGAFPQAARFDSEAAQLLQIVNRQPDGKRDGGSTYEYLVPYHSVRNRPEIV